MRGAFSTNEFWFELPGEGWVERTIHLFRPSKDSTTAFAISRRPIQPDDETMEQIVRSVPHPPDTEKEILKNEHRYFGDASGEDISVLARVGTVGLYHRIVCIPYQGRSLSFQWSGPLAQRDEIDARAERTLKNLRFWQQ